MQTNERTIINPTVPSPVRIWKTFKEWSREHITREGLIDVALALVALDTVVFILVNLYRAFGNYTVTGF